MVNQSTLTELEILSEIIAPEEGNMSADAAVEVLKWKFSDRAVLRMNELASKNREDRISHEELQELDRFLRVGNLINLLHAKARLSLKNRLTPR